MTYFYTKYISIESVLVELNSLSLSDKERMHLASLIDSSLHHAILDEVLSNLSLDDKKLFMKLLAQENHEKVMEFLNVKIEGIESKIKKVADDLILKMHKDMKEAKKS